MAASITGNELANQLAYETCIQVRLETHPWRMRHNRVIALLLPVQSQKTVGCMRFTFKLSQGHFPPLPSHMCIVIATKMHNVILFSSPVHLCLSVRESQWVRTPQDLNFCHTTLVSAIRREIRTVYCCLPRGGADVACFLQ